MPPTRADDAALDELLSEPTPDLTTDLAAIDGDIVVLGVGGKMGPTLARLARRSLDASGTPRRVIGVARFSEGGVREQLEAAGIETIQADLLDRHAVRTLPDAANVIFMAGQKFGTSADPATTWAMNAWLPTLVAERYADARMVVFSTGNVYPLWPAGSNGPTEADPVDPVGEYAQSALARERLVEFFSRRLATPVATLRLNYAVEPRYGVLRDIADRVRAGQPIDVTMGWVNVIWQRDANAVALRALGLARTPPFLLNVAGPKVAVRDIASSFAARFGVAPVLVGQEADTALLSNAARCTELLGAPATPLQVMLDRVADWIERDGRSLDKPTHYDERRGVF